MTEQYDYIICGGGLAGLSLALKLTAPEFSDKRVLVVDRDSKHRNDRTWSFWVDKERERYPHLYYKTWKKLAFHSTGFTRVFEAAPFEYHTIRGIDFYNYALSQIEKSPNVKLLIGNIDTISNTTEGVGVVVGDKTYRGAYAFDSIVKSFPVKDKLFVWQHFLGWEIEVGEEVFEDEVATYMDFRIDQEDDFRFVYVLPFSKKKALIEVTFFSKEICDKHVYEVILKNYMKTYYPEVDYKVTEEELGKIPMTTTPFGKQDGRIIPIGTNNATVKPSSGYAFVRIQDEVDQLVKYIQAGRPQTVQHKKKYIGYDKTLLNVLTTNKENGREIFTMMFEKNDPVKVLKFLNEETSILEEASFFKTLPIWSFTKAWIVENVLVPLGLVK